MKLINARRLNITEYISADVPPYAILSHTWGDEEVTYQDVQDGQGHEKLGFDKIRHCCTQALKDGLEYAWIDTCCIDKQNHAELSEAINSMFRYYAESAVCYAFLSDVEHQPHPDHQGRKGLDLTLANKLGESRWFTRGWTLQELIAPTEVVMFAKNWVEIGTRQKLQSFIAKHANIHEGALGGNGATSIKSFSVAQRMSWCANRQTTREEDIAYCLLGIFDVSMPLLYGEGKRAFLRLQEEIMKDSDDQSIFAWDLPASLQGVENPLLGMLAPSPECFKDLDMVPSRSWRSSEPFAITNAGLQMTALIGSRKKSKETANKLLYLNCYSIWNPDLLNCVPIRQLSAGGDQYARSGYAIVQERGSALGTDLPGKWVQKRVYIRKNITLPAKHEEEETGRAMAFKLHIVTTRWIQVFTTTIYPYVPQQDSIIRSPFVGNDFNNMGNWSWHDALVLGINIEWESWRPSETIGVPIVTWSEDRQCVLLIGYNGRTDRCWCALREVAAFKPSRDLAAEEWAEYDGSTSRPTARLQLFRKLDRQDTARSQHETFVAVDVSLHFHDSVPIFGTVSQRWDKKAVNVLVKLRFDTDDHHTDGDSDAMIRAYINKNPRIRDMDKLDPGVDPLAQDREKALEMYKHAVQFDSIDGVAVLMGKEGTPVDEQPLAVKALLEEARHSNEDGQPEVQGMDVTRSGPATIYTVKGDGIQIPSITITGS